MEKFQWYHTFVPLSYMRYANNHQFKELKSSERKLFTVNVLYSGLVGSVFGLYLFSAAMVGSLDFHQWNRLQQERHAAKEQRLERTIDKTFRSIDVNADGVLDKDEFDDYYRKTNNYY